MPILYLFVGNIAAGKTSLIKEIRKDGQILIDLDKLGTIYQDLKKLEDAINKTFHLSVDNQQDIYVDGSLLSISDRSKYIAYTKKYDYKIICYDFGPGDIKQLKYRIKNNPEYSEKIWVDSFNAKRSSYQEPSKDELIDEIVKIYATQN